MSFGFNPETAIAVFLGVIAWKQLCKGAPCGEGKCCSEAPASAAAPVAAPAAPVAAPVVAPVVAAPAAPAPVATPAPAAPAPAAESDDSALLAVLAAAVAVTLGPKARIVGFSPAQGSHGTMVPANTAWSMEGRREIYLSHRIR